MKKIYIIIVFCSLGLVGCVKNEGACVCFIEEYTDSRLSYKTILVYDDIEAKKSGNSIEFVCESNSKSASNDTSATTGVIRERLVDCSVVYY